MIKNFLVIALNLLLMKDRITIITGASGEIGENLISYFLKNHKKKIIALDLNKSNKKNNVFKFIRGSILDENILEEINEKYIVEEIFHLAAILSTKAEKNKKLAEDVNINGTNNLFNLALAQFEKNGIKTKFFFPSSIAVYNMKNKTDNFEIQINEIDYCNPNTIYGQQKLFCENLGTALDKYGNQQNLKIDFRCIRFPGIISINSLPSGGTSDYAPEMIHSAMNKKHYSCFVNSKSCLPFIVMPDAINAIIQIMATPKSKLKNNVYNITSFSPTVSDLFKIIKDEFPEFEIQYNIDEMRQAIVNEWPNKINDSLAKNDWGWEPKYNFKNAFKNYIFKNMENE